MCRPVECMVCKKTTWAGCGAHVQQVMSVIPPERRCTCREDAKSEDTKSQGADGGVWSSIKKTLGGS